MCLSWSVWETKTEQDRLTGSRTTKHISYSSRDWEIQVCSDGRFSVWWGPASWIMGGHVLTGNGLWGLFYRALTLLIKITPSWPDQFPHTHLKTPNSTWEFIFSMRERLCGEGGGTEVQSIAVMNHIMVIYIILVFVWFLKTELCAFSPPPPPMLFDIHSLLLDISFGAVVGLIEGVGIKSVLRCLEELGIFEAGDVAQQRGLFSSE